MKITLTNGFHNTQVTINAERLPHIITESQERRIHKALCGVTGCLCGSIRGIKPGPDGERLEVERDERHRDSHGRPMLKVSRRPEVVYE